MSQAMESRAFRRMFAPDKLTLGVFLACEAYDGDRAARQQEAELARLADQRGAAALWVQDVGLRDPEYGDVGTRYDSFVYLTYLMGLTENISLATASTVVTHRHPLRLAKEANTLDQLSDGRFVMGVSSGDRPIDFAGFGVEHATRGERFREAFAFYKKLTTAPYPEISSPLGEVPGGKLVPQATAYVPNIVVGQAQQTVEWIAEHGDGWMNYARPAYMQGHAIQEFRKVAERVAPGVFKPFAQPLFVNLLEDPAADVQYQRAGFTAGRDFLLHYLEELRGYGVNHVALAFRGEECTRPKQEMWQEVFEEVLPHFPALETALE